MAHTAFQCEVLTPEGEAFNGEVEMVSTRTGIGSIGVLAGHQPLLAMLEPTELRLYRSESDVERFAQGEGFLQVTHDSKVMVLVDELRPVDALDVSDIRSRLERADQECRDAEDGSEAQRLAQREKKRYEAFLKLAGG
jgi:F-type H+-transporting ATPase subunit epsilon